MVLTIETSQQLDGLKDAPFKPDLIIVVKHLVNDEEATKIKMKELFPKSKVIISTVHRWKLPDNDRY